MVTMVPVIHGAGWQIQNQHMGIIWVLITLVLNVLGATAYAIKAGDQTPSNVLLFPTRQVLTETVSRALVQ